MDVVIAHAMYQQIAPAQAIGKIHRRIVVIARGIFLRRAHVALRVNGVVPLPVGNRRHRNGIAKHLISLEDAVGRHVSPVAPAEDADFGFVYKGLFRQIVGGSNLVFRLVLAQLEVGHFLELLAPRARTPVVHADDHEALLGQHLKPPVILPAPTVHDRLAARTAIDVHEEGVFFCGVKIRRLDHIAV